MDKSVFELDRPRDFVEYYEYHGGSFLTNIYVELVFDTEEVPYPFMWRSDFVYMGWNETHPK